MKLTEVIRRPLITEKTSMAREVSTVVVFEVAARAVSALQKRADEIGLGDEADFLQTYQQILDDSRFLERAIELIDLKRSIGGSMAEVAREAARAARMTGDPFSERRARDIEDLCDAVTMLAASDPRAEVPSKAVERQRWRSLLSLDLRIDNRRCWRASMFMLPSRSNRVSYWR